MQTLSATLLRLVLCMALAASCRAQKYFNSSLVILSPHAGEAATIEVRFAPFRDTIAAGTAIPLTLKDFSLCDSSCVTDVNVLGNQFASTATWTENISTLLLTTSLELVGDRQVKVVIPVEAGIKLPDEGLDPFSREFTLCPAETDCDINTIPAVGSFLHPTIPTELRYSQTPPLYAPAQAGRSAEVLTIRFWNNMRILQGESVVLTLSDFTAAEFEGFTVIDSNFQWSASWSTDTFHLTFLYVGLAPIDSRLNVLSLQNKIAVASNGAEQNDPRLLISSNSQNGPVLPTPIQVSPFVTGLILSSELTFVKRECFFNGFQWVCLKSRARAGDPAEIRFSFTLSIAVARREQVSLHLPDISGASRSTIPVTDGSGFGDDNLGQSLLDKHPYNCGTESQCMQLSYSGTGLFKRASWESSTRTLTFTATSAVPQNTQLVLLMPQAAGLVVPSTGVRVDDRRFQMESNAADGPVPAAPLQAVFPVGKLENQQLEFDPPVPGSNTSVILTFSAKMDLHPQDVLTLMLPQFLGDARRVTMPESPHFHSASWSPHTETLELSVKAFVPAETVVRVEVPVEVGIAIPSSGIVGADSNIRFSLEAAAGPVPEDYWAGVQDVPGLLDQTEVSYGALNGIGPTSLNFSFTASARIERGTIQLFLPDFPQPTQFRRAFAVKSFRLEGGRRAGTWVLDDHFQEGIWNTTGPSLQFVLTRPIEFGESIIVHVPKSVGVTLPALGTDGRGISAIVRGVQTLANTVLTSPPIAAAFSAINIAFGSPKAASVTPISISFSVDSPGGLVPRDELEFRLRGWFTETEPRVPPFPGYDPEYDVTFLSQEPVNAFREAKWTAFSNVLVMTVNTELVSSMNTSKVRVVLDPSSAAIMIPDAGVRVLDPTISFRGVIGGQVVLPSPVSYVQPVGALPQSPKLEFDNARAGEVSAIKLTLRAYMPLEAGDTVTLNLTDFQGTSVAAISTSSPSLVPTASWSNETHLLIYTVGALNPIPADTEIVVEIGEQWGIRIPAKGLSRTASCAEVPHTGCPLLVSVKSSRYGSILPDARTPIHDYSPIGMFPASKLVANPRVAGRPSTLTIEFVYQYKITAGDELRLFLDEFTVADNLGVAPVITDGIFGDMGWQVSRGGVLIRLLAQSDAPPLERQTIRIDSSVGIRTPRAGVTADNVARMTISINAIEGIVLDTPILETPSIGAFILIDVALDPASAGSVSEMTFRITASMDILQGEQINITLNGFTGQEQVTLRPVAQIQNETSGEYYSVPWLSEGQWTLASEIITMRAEVDIPRRTHFRVIIPRDAGIAIPAGGLATAFEAIQIGISAASGWIDPYPVPLAVKTVPAVLRNTRFTASPPLAGAIVQMDIRIQSRLKLNPGATIEIILPDFTDGAQCWIPSATEEEIERRCLPREDLTQDDLDYRFCEDIDPTINSFQQRFRGGCKFTPMVRLLAHRDVPQSIGSCECLNDPQEVQGARNAWAAKFGNTRPPLPPNYGLTCGAWDNTEEAPCNQLWSYVGPHCCSNWCFVSPSCPTSIPWEGNESLAFSYDTCADSIQRVSTCEFNSPPEGLADIATASWSPLGGRLVLTIEQPIQAFVPFNVMIPSSANIRLPMRGLQTNAESLTVDLLDGLSRMPPSPIENTAAVGSFHDLHITSSSSIVGRPTELTMQFTPSMRMRIDTVLYAVFPSFSSRRSTFSVISHPSDVFSNASWTEVTHTMALTVGIELLADVPVVVTIPDGVVSIPPRGLRGGISEGVLLFTDAVDGPVLEQFPSVITDVPVIGSLLNTAVQMLPMQRRTALRFSIDFTPQMEIDAGESVVLTLPIGFTGPRASSLIMNPESMEPPDAFEVFWSFDDTPPPPPVNGTGSADSSGSSSSARGQPTITFTALTLPVPAGTHCRIVIAATCVFLVDLRCSADAAPIMWTGSGDYNPLELTLSSDARAGQIPPTPVRLSSVMAPSPLSALNGSWAGDLYTNVASLAGADKSHLYSCLSVAFECPSTSGYRCFSINVPSTLDVAGNRGWLGVPQEEILIPDLNKAYVFSQLSASLSLDSYNGYQLSMSNLTGGGKSLCAYARPMHRVDMRGRFDTALELLVPFFFQATSSIPYHIRLRIQLDADPDFNPFGFEMEIEGERNKLKRAIAITTEVDEERVTFMSYLPNYPPIEECSAMQCKLEIRIEADTEDQKQNGEIWSAKIQGDIESGLLQDRMWQEDLIASASLAEPIFASPMTAPAQACPGPPQGRLSPIVDDWSSGRGDPVDRKDFGFASSTSATCRHRIGAINGDEIDYDDAYTLDYEVIGLLVKQSRPADLSQFQGIEQSAVVQAGGGDTGSEGGASASAGRRRVQSMTGTSRSVLMCIFVFLVYHAMR